MAVVSPISDRLTVVAMLLLTFATGLVDAVSVLVLGHVFVANMTGNVVFLGFWFAPDTSVNMGAAVVAFTCFLIGVVIGGRFALHLAKEVRLWLTVALGTEVVLLLIMAMLVGTGALDYHTNQRLILIAVLAVTFGAQSAAARQFGVQELSTTVLTGTVVGIGIDSRLAGGSGSRLKLRVAVVATMCLGAGVGATLLHVGVPQVIALAAAVIALALLVFRHGPLVNSGVDAGPHTNEETER